MVSSKDVPEHLRQTINVESGLNDGLVLPFVLLGAILASAPMEGVHTDGLAISAILQTVLGPLIDLTIGWVGAKAIDAAQNKALIAEAAGGAAFLTVAYISFIGSEIIGGNGFIAGMVFRNTYRHDIHFIGEFMEGVVQFLTKFAFLIFGALLLPDGLEHMTGNAVVQALLFLTVVRMLPHFDIPWGHGASSP